MLHRHYLISPHPKSFSSKTTGGTTGESEVGKDRGIVKVLCEGMKHPASRWGDPASTEQAIVRLTLHPSRDWEAGSEEGFAKAQKSVLLLLVQVSCQPGVSPICWLGFPYEHPDLMHTRLPPAFLDGATKAGRGPERGAASVVSNRAPVFPTHTLPLGL